MSKNTDVANAVLKAVAAEMNKHLPMDIEDVLVVHSLVIAQLSLAADEAAIELDEHEHRKECAECRSEHEVELAALNKGPRKGEKLQ